MPASAYPKGCPGGLSHRCCMADRCRNERASRSTDGDRVFDEYGPVRMIRSQDWKLVWRYPSGPHELYNVDEDPREVRNLFNHPGQTDRIRDLRGELDAWFETYVDPVLDGLKLGVTGRGQRDHATQEDAFAYRFPWLD